MLLHTLRVGLPRAASQNALLDIRLCSYGDSKRSQILGTALASDGTQ